MRQTQAVAAAGIGTILEWYDFIIYGLLATYMGPLFFPSDNPQTALLSSLAVFGLGFLGRPIGSVYFGWFGDKYGRKPVLIITMWMMCITTLIMTVMPTYDQIGILAPIALVVLRLVQGVSVGGESSGAFIYLAEVADSRRRGFFASLHQTSASLGLWLGSVVIAILVSFLGDAVMSDWGWRVPFLIGTLIGPVGYLIRKNVEESPAFLEVNTKGKVDTSTHESFFVLSLKSFFYTLFWAVSAYTALNYMPIFAKSELNMQGSQAFWATSIAILAYCSFVPLVGLLSDRFGRKPFLVTAAIGFLLLSYPTFAFLSSGVRIATFIVVAVAYACMHALWSAPSPAMISEQFPTHLRSRLAIGYSIANVFGGFTPFIATWLISEFGTKTAPSYYVTAIAVLGLLVVITMKDNTGKPLN